jgi:putative ABC transport system ATP-binding protein
MTTAAVELLEVERHYRTPAGPVKAINGVTLTIPSGSQVAFMGPSGCGKSTLLGLVGALESPTSGSVVVLGQRLELLGDEDRAAYRRDRLGFLFQAYDLLPFLTVTENVKLQAGISGRSGEIDVDELLERLGLGSERDKLPDQLSGGQKQRVGIARCLAHSPALVLADEPTGQLDSATSAQVIEILLSTVRSIGATALVVTHDAGVASNFDRVVSLNDGRVVQDSAPVAAVVAVEAAIGA